MDALQAWVEHAPRAAPLVPPQRWHVFLSYRSVHRPWVINLYDVLRALGFEVFLDQYVLKPTDTLVLSLGEALDQSASGVLVWSSATADSAWCKQEYARMQQLESKGRGFHYVVAKLDAVDLPSFADDKIWIDFTEYRDGPCGSGLLRLLHGLMGDPLPVAAGRLAADVDSATRHAAAAVRAARKNGDAQRLKDLAKTQDLAWLTTPALGCLAAEGLIALKRHDIALAILAEIQGRFRRAVRVKQLQGLALARKGDVRAAQDILGALVEEGEQDPETLSIYARTWKDRWAESKNTLYLERSRNTYAKAFALTPSDYYSGINAASMSTLLGDAGDAERYAAAVEKLVGALPVDGDYWKSATIAEVQLIRRNYDDAARLYRAAVAMVPDEIDSHASSRTQAMRLLDAQGASPEQRALVLKAFPPVS